MPRIITDEPGRLSHDAANRRLARDHDEWRKRYDCHPGTFVVAWQDCDMFSVARLRGVGYTIYLVPLVMLDGNGPGQRYMTVKWHDDGGVATDAYLNYATALLIAAATIATEPEYLEHAAGRP